MTIKQEWSRIRCFATYGRLIAIRNSLQSISTNNEILPSEAVQITITINSIHKLISSFNTTTSKTLSFEQYCKIKKTGVKTNVKKKS
jgi:hypothetical protein